VNPLGIQLTLQIGEALPLPAPATVVEALASVSVTHNDSSPSTFQLQFNADRATPIVLPDFPILLERVVAIGNRVIVTVTLGGVPYVLMDGFITTQDLSHQRETGTSSISVTGEDVGIQMDLHEKSLEYPGLGDPDLVALLLAEYAMYGVVPTVMPTETDEFTDSEEWTQQQNGTDRATILELAEKHGYVFLVRPGPLPGTNEAYWGPPPRLSLPQSALTVDMGAGTNVESISFTYNGLAAETYQGMLMDDELDEPEPVLFLGSVRVPPLAAEPAVLVQQPFVKSKLYNETVWTESEALELVTGLVDRSADGAVTGSGTLDTLRYNAILEVPGLVGVRGAGLSYDGLYYVRSVTHQIERGSYKQSFQITREGVTSTVPVVPA
jgi:hypothetical protein